MLYDKYANLLRKSKRFISCPICKMVMYPKEYPNHRTLFHEVKHNPLIECSFCDGFTWNYREKFLHAHHLYPCLKNFLSQNQHFPPKNYKMDHKAFLQGNVNDSSHQKSQLTFTLAEIPTATVNTSDITSQNCIEMNPTDVLDQNLQEYVNNLNTKLENEKLLLMESINRINCFIETLDKRDAIITKNMSEIWMCDSQMTEILKQMKYLEQSVFTKTTEMKELKDVMLKNLDEMKNLKCKLESFSLNPANHETIIQE